MTSTVPRQIDLAEATRLEGGSGHFHAELDPDISSPLGPLGGYIAGIALRAAGATTAFDRPSSFTCHFLKPAKPGQVDVEVDTLRSTKRAESLHVAITQGSDSILEAIAWTTSEMTGAEHSFSMPDVPGPESLLPIEEVFAEWQAPAGPRLSEFRPIFGVRPDKPPPWLWSDWENLPPQGPYNRGWSRLLVPVEGDAFLKAASLLPSLDGTTLQSAFAPHRRTGGFVLPHMDLSVYFHDVSPTEWIFGDGDSPRVGNGLAWGRALLWSRDGRLLASGTGQMMQRPFTWPQNTST